MIYFNSSVLRFALLILMLAVGLAACGGEPDDDDSADDDDDDSADDDDDSADDDDDDSADDDDDDSAAPSGTA